MRARYWVSVLLSVCNGVSACQVPPDALPAFGTVHLPGVGLNLISGDSESLTALRATDASVAWRYTPHKRRTLEFAKSPGPYITCPPRITADRLLMVPFTDKIVALNAETGVERWVHEYRTRADVTICPAIAPDSSVVYVSPNTAGGRSILVKLDRLGQRQWLRKLPEIGRVEQAPAVDVGTGDVFATTRTHIVSVNPRGKVNWIRKRPTEGG
ncbi:MAG TPA: PQQ-binding-like beta-propeller repeat protein [Polyangiaceae bacterium]|nr:PQQ-binding-like beta-propeller repeat protein [Polyangiaceae bacterium]